MYMFADRLDSSWISNEIEYYCDQNVADFVMLQRLSTGTGWCDLRNEFGSFSSQLSKVFWEMIELLADSYGHLLHLREEFLCPCAVLYSKAVESAGASPDKYVGFKDCI